MPIEEIREVFKRINSTSYGLNAMELHNSRFNGEFKRLGEKASELPFFEQHKVFTSSDIKRMNDVKYCLNIIIAMMSTYTNRDKELEAYLEIYNEEFPKKEIIMSEFIFVLRFVDNLNFDSASRVYKKADFYTLFIELHRALYKDKIDLEVSRVRSALDVFYNNVEKASIGGAPEDSEYMTYYKAALQASNDRSSRIARGNLIKSVLNAEQANK